MSIQDIRQNPQDTSNFYLANIYQTLADPNRSNTSVSPPSSPPPFSPPNHAVWVNALWFLSLVISLTCALLATLLQQWARRYLKITQSRYSPHKRARIRAFFSEGVEKCLLPWAVEILPTLLHISLSLFFAGLVVFLCNVDLTIFKLVSSWVCLCAALYGCITCMPIIRHDSPYYTPLSLPVWHLVTGTRFIIYKFLRWFNDSVRFRSSAYFHFRDLEKRWFILLVQGMQKTAEETALTLSSEIDARAFMWTFDCLDEDHELERFFSGLPGFRSSSVVDDPLPSLTGEEKRKLYGALDGFLDRTFSSYLLPATLKNRRAMICVKAVGPERTPNAFRTFDAILSEYQHSGPVATAIAKILRGWGTNVDQDDILDVQFAISRIIATRQPGDDSWYSLASNELALPEVVLREYASHGDSLSLVILIHVVRHQFTHFWKPSWQRHVFSSVLVTASNFDARDTSQKLQHDFCALWNQIVNEVQHSDDWDMAGLILGRIRNIFLALHHDTDSVPTCFSFSTNNRDNILFNPTSYPVCKVTGHHPDSPSHIHDYHASTTFTPALLDDHDNIALVPSLTSPDLPSPSTRTPQVDKQISAQGSLQPIGQTTIESHRIPTTSRSPVTACTTHSIIDHSSRTVYLSASEPSISYPPPRPNTSASPSDDVAVGRTERSHTPSNDLNVQSFSMTVLDAILPTGLLLFPSRDSI